MRNAMGENTKRNTDWWTFFAAVTTIFILCLPMVLAPEASAKIVRAGYDAITQKMGVFYQWYGIAALGFLIYLATSRFGSVRLGPKESRPEFRTLSWIAMLFSAGIGAGLLYWAVIEWGYYIDSPPFGQEPRSTAAIESAASYGLFHWGIMAWAFY